MAKTNESESWMLIIGMEYLRHITPGPAACSSDLTAKERVRFQTWRDAGGRRRVMPSGPRRLAWRQTLPDSHFRRRIIRNRRCVGCKRARCGACSRCRRRLGLRAVAFLQQGRLRCRTAGFSSQVIEGLLFMVFFLSRAVGRRPASPQKLRVGTRWEFVPVDAGDRPLPRPLNRLIPSLLDRR